MATQNGQRRAGGRLAWPATAAVIVLAMLAAPAWAAGLLVADGGLGGVLEIQEHSVDVTINNGVAVTTVTQVFRNTEGRAVEALYTFPVPKAASVANFSMWINGKEMIGEVVEKKRAREIYESYKPRKVDPGLLEQTDYRSFEMRIFPIAAGATQKVQVSYYQELDVDGDWATYVYPLASSTRPGADAKTTGRFALNLHVKSEVPIVAMESPSHGQKFVVASHSEAYWQASIETTGGDLSRDVVLAYHLLRERTGFDLIASRTAGEDGYFCLTLTAGKELADKAPGMDYVFILDVSGSMASEGKLNMSQRTLGSFVEGLGEKDRFEVLTFNVTAEALFKRLQPAEGKSKAQAAEYLAGRSARGGTVLRPALSAAYRYHAPDRTLNVVILSDGLTEQAERAELVDLIRQRPAGTRVFCVGVGNDVNRPLLSQLADDAGGLSAFLSREDDFQRQAKAFRRKLSHPAAADPRITFEGGEVYDVEPVRLPNLYHGAPIRVFGRYRRSGQVKVTLKAEVEGRQITAPATMELPETDASNPQIERMWAWHRMDRLLKESDGSGGRERVIAEVVRLGEGYSITSEHTSFIVLENDGEYQRWKIDRRNERRIGRDRKAQERLAAELESMRRTTAAKLGPKVTGPDAAGPVLASPFKPADAAQPSVAPAPVPTPPPAPRQRGRDINLFPRSGGGPVGPLSGGIIAVLALAHWRRRRKADPCSKKR